MQYVDIEKALTVTVKKGNENEIIFVANPFCKHCKEAYKMVKDLVLSAEGFTLRVVYLDGKSAVGRIISKQFISIYFLNGEDAYLKAVEEWYDWGSKNYPVWQKKFNVNNYANAEDILIANENWAREAKISATPTILVNNKIIPNEFEVNDLMYF
ncbi:MAG: hypothetical protein EOP48_03270 [Sphingobacteriales bacterium]|nr:MAG: hypothetical protein EOP48_03270 [Sphingobacteriales bacterium]